MTPSQPEKTVSKKIVATHCPKCLVLVKVDPVVKLFCPQCKGPMKLHWEHYQLGVI